MRERQADTARTLQQASDIIKGSTHEMIIAGERQNAGVDYLINGEEVVETTADGKHWRGNSDVAQAPVTKDPQKYRIVPTDEYRAGDY